MSWASSPPAQCLKQSSYSITCCWNNINLIPTIHPLVRTGPCCPVGGDPVSCGILPPGAVVFLPSALWFGYYPGPHFTGEETGSETRGDLLQSPQQGRGKGGLDSRCFGWCTSAAPAGILRSLLRAGHCDLRLSAQLMARGIWQNHGSLGVRAGRHSKHHSASAWMRKLRPR